MLWEKTNNVAQLNSYNNAKLLGKSEKDTWQYKYNSSARNVIRMWWLTTFITHLMELLVNSDKTLQTCLTESYTVAFSPHHPWLIQKGAKLAMYAAGQREGFYKLAQVEGPEAFTETAKLCAILRDALTKFLTEQELEKLP